MKKVLFTGFALFAGIALSLATHKVTTRISFGKESKGCSGLGICSARTTTQSGRLTSNWQYQSEQGTLLLDIPEEELVDHETQVLNNNFVQEEDYTLPAEICMQLGLTGRLIIPAGKYAARHAEGRCIITFSVREE